MKLDADKVAEIANMSIATLNRKLKATIEMTATAYIKELRLLYAKKALKAKTYNSVKEVSVASGFSRPNYFAKEFFKRFGKNPSEYF